MWSMGELVRVLRQPARDRFGDTTGWVVHHSIKNVVIEPASTNTPDAGVRDLVQADVVLYCPPGTDIADTDRLTLPDGRTYFVTGLPQSWRSPFTGRMHGVRVYARVAA